jgi:hypothetical protein
MEICFIFYIVGTQTTKTKSCPQKKTTAKATTKNNMKQKIKQNNKNNHIIWCMDLWVEEIAVSFSDIFISYLNYTTSSY